MDKKTYWSKIGITAATIGGLACIPQLLNWGFNTTLFGVWVSSLFQIGCVVVVLYVFGKQVAELSDNGDGYSYGDAYVFALVSSLCAGVVSAIISWLLINVIDPQMGVDILEKASMAAAEAGAPESAIESSLSIARFFFSFPGLLVVNVLSMLLIGGLAGLITASLVKRNVEL